MTTVVATSAFDFESDEYRHLYERATTTAFQHPQWLTTFYRHIPQRVSAQPLVLAGYGAARELQAVVPMLIRGEGSEVTIDFAHGGVTDYACPVIDPGLQRDSSEMKRLSRRFYEALPDHGVLRIAPVREEHRSLWTSLLECAPAPLPYSCHEVQPGSPFPEWRERAFSRKRNRQLDRKLRRLVDQGAVDLKLLSGLQASEALAWIGRIRAGRFEGDPLQDEHGLNFYCEIAGAERGFARTYQLQCKGRPVATCFGVADGRRFSYLVLGCDYERFAGYSPGMLVLNKAMADWVTTGGEIFDFTIGDEPFKRHFRCTSAPMLRFETRSHAP